MSPRDWCSIFEPAQGGTKIELWEGYEKLDADDQYFYKEVGVSSTEGVYL